MEWNSITLEFPQFHLPNLFPFQFISQRRNLFLFPSFPFCPPNLSSKYNKQTSYNEFEHGDGSTNQLRTLKIESSSELLHVWSIFYIIEGIHGNSILYICWFWSDVAISGDWFGLLYFLDWFLCVSDVLFTC